MEIKNIIAIFAVTKYNEIMNTNKHIPVGIFDDEIFIAELTNEGKIRGFDVLRPVTPSELESYRDPDDDDTRDHYKELWQMAVAGGSYEGSLSDYIEEDFNEYDLDDDEEMWPGKDESGLEYLTEEAREEADRFMDEERDITIGTWECSGWFPPTSAKYRSEDGEFKDRFEKWDFIFDNDEARRLAKEWKKLYR